MNKNSQKTCMVCGKSCSMNQLVSGAIIRDSVTQVILKNHPDWSADSVICKTDLAKYRAQYVQGLLASERGELTSLDQGVLSSLAEHQVLSMNIESAFEQQWTFGEKLADRIATFGGSWSFLILFGVAIVIWIIMNSMLLYFQPVDPYPYIFLNLILSCVAALQAPVIMMSQNRQEAKDSLRAQHDYQINLKAELEIRQLHEKVDHLLSHQWERLVQIQEVQLDLLSELGHIKSRV